MKYIIKEKICCGKDQYTAGGKAREDVDFIAEKMKAENIKIEIPYFDKKQSIFKQIKEHYKIYKLWNDKIKDLSSCVLFIQFPLQGNFIFVNRILKKLKKNRVKTIAITHDLETIRAANIQGISRKRKIRLYIQEIPALKNFSKIIVHNTKMKKYLENKGINRNKMVNLNIFDYIIEDEIKKKSIDENNIVIAGNLSEEKSGYIYNLPSNVVFDLYGINYKDCEKENIRYHGSYPSNELPKHLNGKFGLVWDGPEADSCTGVFGEYLRWNNPHKTSLYLACGIPVIVWKEAAIAKFIVENDLGLAVESINSISEILDKLSEKKYQEIFSNVQKISIKLRNGYFMEKALKKAME